MSSIRMLISIVLLIVGALVGLHMVFDAFYAEEATAGQVWDYINWASALAMILALIASIRRVTLAGHTDAPAKVELLFVIGVALVFFHTWTNHLHGTAVTGDAWMLVDALAVLAFLAVGLRLLRLDADGASSTAGDGDEGS